MTDVLILKNGKIILSRSLKEILTSNDQTYRLITQDMSKTKEVLMGSSINFTSDDNVYLISREDVDKTQNILIDHHIYLQELSPNNGNLEKIVVQILEKEEVQ